MTGFVFKEDGYYYAPPIDPFDVKDYTLDMTSELGADTIPASSVVWEIEQWKYDPPTGPGLVILTANNSNTATTATVWLKSAEGNNEFLISAKVTTTGGRKLRKSFKLQVRPL